jgi:hypothetical protein
MKLVLSLLGVALIALVHQLEGGQATDLFQPMGLVLVLGPTLFFSLAHHSGRDLMSAIGASWGDASLAPEAAARHAAVLCTPRVIALAGGCLGFVIGLINVFHDLSDPNHVGAGLAMALVSVLYGLIVAELLIAPMIHRLESHLHPAGRTHIGRARPSVLILLMATLGTMFTFVTILFAIERDSPGVRTVQEHEITTFLKPGELVGHPVLETDLGAAERSKLVLFSLKDGVSEYGAFVVADDKRIPVEVPEAEGAHSGFSAVLFHDLDGDYVMEIIIMRTFMSGAGPQGAEDQPHNFVLDWDGTKFVVLTELTEKIQGHSTSEQIYSTLSKESTLINRTAHKTSERAKKPKE